MRLVIFLKEGKLTYGVLQEDLIFPLGAPPYKGIYKTGETVAAAGTRLLPPCSPSKIVAVGLNYKDHAKEIGVPLPEEPLLFLKPSTSVLAPEADIVYPRMSKRVDYEAELGVVIGKLCRHVSEAAAKGYILGYTAVNDVTARDLQQKDGQWTRSKSFDTFAPLGPWIETEIKDPNHLAVEAFLNGERRQHSNTDNLIFGVYKLVSFISRVMTLLPGDVIATGTPAGIGPMQPGDVIEVRLEGIGTLRNRLVMEETA